MILSVQRFRFYIWVYVYHMRYKSTILTFSKPQEIGGERAVVSTAPHARTLASSTFCGSCIGGRPPWRRRPGGCAFLHPAASPLSSLKNPPNPAFIKCGLIALVLSTLGFQITRLPCMVRNGLIGSFTSHLGQLDLAHFSCYLGNLTHWMPAYFLKMGRRLGGRILIYKSP